MTTRKSEDVVTASLAVMANDIGYIKTDVVEIKKKLEADYVTRAEFDPIKKVVYGLVGIVLTGVAGAILSLVIQK